MTKKAQKMSFRAKSETYMQKYVMVKLVMTRESLNKITKNRRTKK